jgi:N-acetylneuraminic acid mutarotase
MRKTLLLLLLLAAAVDSRAAIQLPASRVIAGPLDDTKSLMGDAIFNYPFGSGVGAVNIHGWVSVEFSEPVGRTVRFRLRWHGVGDVPLFAFASGHFLRVRGEQNFSSVLQPSLGVLNLDTGEVTNLEAHAIYQNVLIQKSSRYDRLPSLSDLSGFSALFVDFPPLEFPFELPFRERPQVSLNMRFVTDANQRITGLELRGVTFLPITVLPSLGIMPPFTFARKGVTVVPGTDGCLPGTLPPSQCLSEERVPDGVDAAPNAYLSPRMDLISSEMREIAAGARVLPAALPGAVLGAAGAALGGRMYVAGGSDGERAIARASVFDPARNEWTALPEMPRAVVGHCAAAAGGRVYVLGGREAVGGAPLAAVASYDPAARAWTGGVALPAPAAEAACAALDTRVYVFGGATGSGAASDAGWVLDTATGQWSALPRMPLALAGSATAVAGREIWVINGTTDGRAATNRVLVYAPDTGRWREAPVTPRALYGASAAALENRVFLAGGRSGPNGPLDLSEELYQNQTMLVYSSGAWWDGLIPALPAARMAAAVVGDNWYLAGGDTAALAAAPAASRAVQAFHAALGWAISATTPLYTAQTVRNAAGLGVGPAELAPGAAVAILGSHLVLLCYK